MADRYSYSYRRDAHFFTYSNTPSFSSALLEEIYRSIDQGGDREEAVLSMRKKRDDANVLTEEMTNYQRPCIIEKWMEKKVTEKIVVQGRSMADFRQVKMVSKDRQGSPSSSSDSSCGGFSSSSELGETCPVINRPKPVRTGGEHGKSHRKSEIDRLERRGFSDQLEQKSKHGFLKTKSRALQIYGDLKKSKQPISPGGKVAAFLNSLFTASNLKKPKFAATCGGDRDSSSLKSTHSNTSCSPASSFSRSCLSKTSSKSSGSGKRSVRFSPVSIIVKVKEGRHPCEQKPSYQGKNTNNNTADYVKTAIDEELMVHIMEKSRRVEEAERYFLMNNHKKDKVECESELPLNHLSKIDVENREFYEEEDEDEGFDAASCASSDLFELNNLSAIGIMERYTEELPVYETTNLEKIQTMQMI